MIYIRGDTHGQIGQVSEAAMSGESSWTHEDVLIVAGDFGFVFMGEQSCLSEKNNLDFLARKPYTILFVDGNHEGFPFLKHYPEEIRYGAPVRRIRSNIFWLQRGYVYTIEGHTFFVMGGASSVDRVFRQQYFERTGERIWFEEELPTQAEYTRAIANLSDRGRKTDYIITHTAPASVIFRLTKEMPDEHEVELAGFLDWIYHEICFKKWFFGHFHVDQVVDKKVIACFKQVHKLE